MVRGVSAVAYDRADRSQGQTTATGDNGHQPLPRPDSIQKAVNETLLCPAIQWRLGQTIQTCSIEHKFSMNLIVMTAWLAASGGILFRTRFGR